MIRKLGRLVFLGFVCVVFACQPFAKKQTELTTQRFFDLDAYFSQEAIRLLEKNPLVLKKIAQDQSIQQKQVRISNWEKELKIFQSSAINDDKLKNLYTVDTTAYDNGRILVHIEAIDKELYTQLIDLEILEDTLVSLLILNKVVNPVYETQHILNYSPDVNYSILKHQKVRFSASTEYHIEVDFASHE